MHPASVDFGLRVLPAGLDKGLSLRCNPLADYLKVLNPTDCFLSEIETSRLL